MRFLKLLRMPLVRRLLVAVLVVLARELADWRRPRG